jgi:uncharacterized membrane protein
MFERTKYKSIAKKQLKGRYKTPALAVFLTIIINLLLTLPVQIKSIQNIADNFKELKNQLSFNDEEGFIHSFNFEWQSDNINNDYSSYGKIAGGIIELINNPSINFNNYSDNIYIDIVINLFVIFITSVMNMALYFLFISLSHTREIQGMSTFFSGFSLYLKGFLGYLYFMLFVTLWWLLFIIPGIVKSISYSWMFYIIAEHPDIDVRKAMRLSKELTRGKKGEIFIMWLSFLGWKLLALIIPFGLFNCYLKPYENMAFINAYHHAKANAIASGYIKEEDFCGQKKSENTDNNF